MQKPSPGIVNDKNIAYCERRCEACIKLQQHAALHCASLQAGVKRTTVPLEMALVPRRATVKTMSSLQGMPKSLPGNGSWLGMPVGFDLDWIAGTVVETSFVACFRASACMSVSKMIERTRPPSRLSGVWR